MNAPTTLVESTRGRLLTIALTVIAVGWAVWNSIATPVALGILDREPHPGLEDEPFFPPPDPAMDRVIAAVRAELTSLAAGEPSVPAVAETERECLVSVYVPRGRGEVGPYVAPWTSDVVASVADLWTSIPLAAKFPEFIAQSRIKIDCVLPGERTFDEGGGYRGMLLDQGLDGIVLRRDGETYRWLPSWAIEKPVARRHMLRSARRMARRDLGWSKKEARSASYAAFRTRSYVESKTGGAVLAVARGNVEGPELTPANLRESISTAGAYMARETNSRGKITYHYDDRKDSLEGGYNLLRHAGSVYSMLQAYRISGDKDVLDASERAIGYFRRTMKEDKDHPGEWFAVEGRRAKLGAIGLGLLMFVEHAKVAPERASDLELLRGMGRHIDRMMLPSGELVSFHNWDGKEKSTRKSIFYSGEAILGLVRLHQLTGEERWKDVAVKASDFLVHKRWVALGIRLHVPPDAWLLQALVELDRVAPDSDRAAYANALGKSIARLKLLDEEKTPPDLLGGEIASLNNLPPTATAGSFGEALSAWARLEARRDPSSTVAREIAAKNARFQLRSQLRTANTWYLSNPARAHGGWRKRMASGEVRNDHVQHNLSGLFGILSLYDEDAPDIGLQVGGVQ